MAKTPHSCSVLLLVLQGCFISGAPMPWSQILVLFMWTALPPTMWGLQVTVALPESAEPDQSQLYSTKIGGLSGGLIE